MLIDEVFWNAVLTLSELRMTDGPGMVITVT